MKHAIISIIMILAAAVCQAQEYEPTSTWPYIYNDFTEGRIHKIGGKESTGLFNVHILKGRLHFIDGEMIREANSADIYSVSIGDDIYCNAGGTMMLVLAKSGKGFVARTTEMDAARLNSTGGAYGSSSSTLATQSLSSLEFAGSGAGAVNHMNLKNSKDEGRILPVIEKIYLVFDGKVIFASKRDVLDIEGVDRDSLNAFLKENRIKWKDPQSLMKIVDFISN